MHNYMRNTVKLGKDHEMKGRQLMSILCPGVTVVKNMEKDRKLKDFYLANDFEKSKSPYTLQ